MAKLVTLQATYRIITPMFLGGADPNNCAELRAPSINGALRFWWRAIDPDYRDREHEARIFGGAGKGEGQAMFLLRVTRSREEKNDWPPKNYGGFDAPGSKNGMRYLSFPLKMGDNERKYIKPGTSFTLQLTFKTLPAIEHYRRIVAALWLLGHLGGLGSRSRRGFGTLALQEWFVEGDTWPELTQLLPAHDAKSAEAWVSKFEAGITKLKEWLQPNATSPPDDHTVLNGKARFYLFNRGYGKVTKQCQENGRPVKKSYEAWEAGLDAAGRAMQDFRQRWDLSTPASDYFNVRNHLVSKAASWRTKPARAPSSTTSPIAAVPLTNANTPKRAAFGLPLTFRYGSIEVQPWNSKGRPKTNRYGNPEYSTPHTTFLWKTADGKQRDRYASPLFVRVVEINQQCHPFFSLLDSPLFTPALGERLIEQGASGPGWTPPNRNLVDDFCGLVLKPASVKEITW